MLEECILNTETTQLEMLRVFNTHTTIWGIEIYGIVTRRRDNGKVHYRFGTYEQIKIILRPYRYSVKDKEQYKKLFN